MLDKVIIPVILCGGSGARLWPLSRERQPKQFLKINGKEPLLYETIDRALKCSGARADQVVTVTLDSLKEKTLFHLLEYNADAVSHVLSEPRPRNTAAAIAYAASYVEQVFGPHSLMWVLPADHFIANTGALRTALSQAVEAADQNYLVTFGMKPCRAEIGYGYIECGAAWEDSNSIFEVRRFVEKPNKTSTEKYLSDENFFWNSGMFVFSAKTVLQSFLKHAPEISKPIHVATASRRGSKALTPGVYDSVPSVPFDKAILEKEHKIAVIPCDIGWSDVGTWESLWEVSSKDNDGNAIDGRVACVETKDCYIRANSLLVATIGLSDLAIVEDGNSILIADKKNSDAMKTLVSALNKAGGRETIDPPHEDRPWGQFRILSESPGYKIKEVLVKPGGKLSLQQHAHRAEFWTVISGKAKITVNDDVRLLEQQETAFIPLHARHRLENPGTKNLVIIEVQCGDYLGEDDITRLDDAYGRKDDECVA